MTIKCSSKRAWLSCEAIKAAIARRMNRHWPSSCSIRAIKCFGSGLRGTSAAFCSISGLGGLFVAVVLQAYHRGTDVKQHGSNAAFAGVDVEVVHGCEGGFHALHFASDGGVGA